MLQQGVVTHVRMQEPADLDDSDEDSDLQLIAVLDFGSNNIKKCTINDCKVLRVIAINEAEFDLPRDKRVSPVEADNMESMVVLEFTSLPTPTTWRVGQRTLRGHGVRILAAEAPEGVQLNDGQLKAYTARPRKRDEEEKAPEDKADGQVEVTNTASQDDLNRALALSMQCDPEKVEQIVSMGFSAEQAREKLAAADGDVEMALALLCDFE